MPKQLIINAIEPREIRAAIIEDGSPANFFVERSTRRYQKGNIYRARVTSIEPHLQAAFVELEKGQHGFLSLSDVIFPDGGMSLANGLPSPPMPEVKKKNGDDKNVEDSKDLKKKEVSSGSRTVKSNDYILFPETPIPEAPAALVFGDPAPLTRLSEQAGEWLLGDLEDPIANIVEIDDEGWESAIELRQQLDVVVIDASEETILDDASQESIAHEVEDEAEQTISSFDGSDLLGEADVPQSAPKALAPKGSTLTSQVDADEEQREESDAPSGPESILSDIKASSATETKASNSEAASVQVVSEQTSPAEGTPVSQVSKSSEASSSSTSDPSSETVLIDDDASADTSVDTAIFEVEGDDDVEGDEGSSEDAKVSDKKSRNDKGQKNKSKAPLRRRRPNLRIEEVLEIGQYLMVQITKEGIGNKAPMVTTFLSCAGHYMVLTPGGDRSGVSKQVRSPQERKRLREFVESSEIPERCGLIVRTAAEGVEMEELQNDIRGLSGVWGELQQSYRKQHRSGLLRKEDDLSTRLVRDYYNQDIQEVWVDAPDVYRDIRDFFQRAMPDQLDRVKLYEGNRPIFSAYELNQPLGELFRKRVNLPGGGSLIFDQGEAMLVIDINSGSFKEGDDDEDTAFRLNMLACSELARQIQMRDVGGIIMIDFVDMRRISSRNKVERELEKHFRGDKAKINIMSIGALGVLQMSRQRTKDSLRGSLYSTCHHCEGTGLVPSKTHSAMGILREIRGNLKRFSGGQIKIATTADMATEMFNTYKSEIVKMEEAESCQIGIEIDAKLGHGEFKLLSKGGRSASKVEKFDDNQRGNKKKRRRKPGEDDHHQGNKSPAKTKSEQGKPKADAEKPKSETGKNKASLGVIKAREEKSKDKKGPLKNVAESKKGEDLKKGSSDQTAPPAKKADDSEE